MTTARANALRGEVLVECAASTYVAVFDWNTFIDLQAELGIEDPQVLAEKLQGPLDPRFVRRVFWHMLQRHHSEIDELEAGGILTELGITGGAAKVMEAFGAGFGRRSVDAKGAANGDARPPSRSTGGGASRRGSTSTSATSKPSGG